MTIADLNELYHIVKEITRDERKIEEYRERASSTTTNLSPDRGGETGPSDKIGNYASLIVDLEKETRRNRDRLLKKELELTQFINSIEVSEIRRACKARFVDCYKETADGKIIEWRPSWTKVARLVRSASGDSIRTRVADYLRTH